MADPASYGNPDRDIEQALIALKKGTQLIKYSRKGKPKFCPFRISPDETTLIWLSHGEERNLKLSSVSRIIPGQRTAVFKRYLRPEKEYLSFSLIYNNGERSLDLICKDKVEAEVWLVGLKALITTTGQAHSRRTRSDISDIYGGIPEPVQNERPLGVALEFTSSIPRNRNSLDRNSHESSVQLLSSDVGLERANMQVRRSTDDGFRISISSTPSCSSGGSGPDDIESLGDVYVWGEVWSEGVSADGSGLKPTKLDVLIPRPLESNVVLDVQQIACGGQHVALVTRQGEVFTWGKDSGGRLGHGIERDCSRPHLVEFLAVNNVDFVSCGEYHTCALSASGDLYTWGDGTHNAGLLGHGSGASHWLPKRVCGPLEGLQVLSVACGTWHSALATSNGKLFTFGDGTFGVLGHGNQESFHYPKEVQSLNGLKTIKVACGVWHTAAIVEVTNQFGANVSSRKLFTWGNGYKYTLGHGNKDSYLLPTCVSSLIDYNFHQLACGHNITIALTTSGHVFTMGSTAHGQLGNAESEGKVPCLVQDKLVGEFVEDISCGSCHVAVLTSRSEVYTWGSGANGRLGHGDIEDRHAPTLVEALKDRHVKTISCGSNYTASICIHKWVSGADQSVCSGCRQAFGFTRKRHNCYNCGLVHCHACSSRKALKAALAPTPGKPHRVCDACYAKLRKAAEAGNSSHFTRRVTGSHRVSESSHRIDRGEGRASRILISPSTEPVKYLEVKSAKPGAKAESYSMVRASQVPSLQQLKDLAFPSSFGSLQYALKPITTVHPHQLQHTPSPPPPPQPPSLSNSRPSSPYARRPSPPRSATPVFSRGVIDSLKKTNDVLHQEVNKLQNQVKSLRQKSDAQDAEIKKLRRSTDKAEVLAAEKSSTCTEALEIFKSITAELNEMTEKLPPEIFDSDAFKAMRSGVESFLRAHKTQEVEAQPFSSEDLATDQQNDPAASDQQTNFGSSSSLSELTNGQDHRMEDHADAAGTQHTLQDVDGTLHHDNGTGASDSREAPPRQSIDGISSSPRSSKGRGPTETVEQFEPGVYVTVIQLSDGTQLFRRVKFSKRRFSGQQAEDWWRENKNRVLRHYSPRISNAGSSTPPHRDHDEDNEDASSS